MRLGGAVHSFVFLDGMVTTKMIVVERHCDYRALAQ